MRAVVLPSPLLGPIGYQPLADALDRAGIDVGVAPTHDTAAQTLAGFVAAVRGAELIVAHSNAGHYAPEVAREAEVERIVFLDAAIPTLGSSRLVSEEFGRTYRSNAVGDLLPKWTRLWPEAEMRTLLGDWFDRIDAAAPHLPIAYLADSVPVPPTWPACAYVAFGSTYADEIEFAHTHAWPVTVLDGHHLMFLDHPDPVANAIWETVTGHFPPQKTRRPGSSRPSQH